MNQQEFIKNFVLKFPRQYVRLISFGYSFSTELLLEYGNLLAWDKYGLLGNSKIVWNSDLKLKFSDRLIGKTIMPLDYIKQSENNYVKIILKKTKEQLENLILMT